MNLRKTIILLFMAAVMTACQFPQQQSSSMPMPPSAPSSSPPSSPSSSPPSSPSSSPPSSSSSEKSGGQPPSGEGAEGESEPAGEAGSPMPEGEEGEAGGVESLDEQLDEALEDFDETVAGDGSSSSEEAVDILNPISNSAASASESDEPLFEEGDLSESGENEAVAQRAAEGAEGAEGEAGESAPIEGELASAGASGDRQAEDADIIPIPDDVGDGRDDDIVQRQIRAAAEKEHDAVLREKLWDEYRRIKGI